MDTLSTTSPVAAALALAEVLALDLPESCLVTVSPWAVNHPCTTAVGLQFGESGALHAWAAHFGVAVEMPGSDRRFAYVYFTHSGVRFECYADTRPEQEQA